MSGLEARLENKINELIVELKMKSDNFDLYQQNQTGRF
jgi:hypothetical protein